MAMAIGEEDEFGDLYADVAMPDFDALARFGSVFRLYEDESDASVGDPRKAPLHYSDHEELLPGAIIAEGYTDSDEEQGQRAGAQSQSKLKDFGSPVDVNGSVDGREHHMEEETEAPFIHSITSLAGSPGSEHIASHGITTASNVAHYVSKQDPLEGKDGVRQGLRGGGVSGLEAEDVDTDSDDDLRIVLNPLHHSLQRTASGGIGEDSEDGEDLLILAGDEAADDQEWQEGMFMPVEDKAQGLPVGGEKRGTLGGEKGHSGKGAGVHQGAPHIGYGGHGYHHHYRYVRASALGGGVGATPGLSTRVTSSKGGSGRGDRIGAGRGFTNCRRISLPPWRNSTPRGFLYGLEYSIPSNKTVFDLDIDSLEEKPWRHPHVDVSDYFNFGFDESSWKEYCKQLAQFHLESTMQSKISVYESGRSGQEFDPDLPPELAMATGLLEASVESIRHRTAAINADMAGGYQGVGREYLNTYPTLHAIRVGGGGVCERRPSADTQARRIRESDAIFLIDVADDDSFKEKSGIDDCQGEEGGDFKTLHGFSPKNQLDLLRKTGVPKKARLTLDSKAKGSGKRSNSVLEGCRAAAGTEIHGRQNVKVFSGEMFTTPPASRHKTPRPSTPVGRMPTQEKRDTDKGQSHSSSLNDGSQLAHEDQVFGTPHRCVAEREENLQLNHSAKVCGGRSLDQALKVCEGDKFSGNMDIKKGGFSKIISHASKKRRLGLCKVNKATRHDNHTAKKSSRTYTLTTGLDANEAHVEAENWQQKKHFSGNNVVEHSIDEKSGGVWVYGSSEHIVEKVKGRTNFSPAKVEYNSKVKNTLKVKNQMQGAHSKPAEDQSKEKLKIKKTKKGHKLKEKVKCKDKVHLPGCPNLERRQKDGSDRAMLDGKQGMKDKPKNCFVAEDDYPSWREVESMSMREKKDQDMGSHELSERGKWLLQYLESEQKTEDRSTEYKSEGLHHGNGKDRQTMDRGAEFFSRKKSEDPHLGHERDGQLCQKKGVHSWKALHIIRSKKEKVKHMLLGVRLTSDNTGLLGPSRYETHAKNNMQVAFSDQESMKEKDKHSEVKEREKACREYLPEVEDQVNCLTTLGGSSVRRHKKHRPKKLQKASSRRGNQPSTAILADEQMQESSKSKLVLQNATELTNERNDGSSTLIDGRENDNPDDNNNNNKVDSEGHQSGNHLTKASNSKLSHGFMETPSGNGYVGFDMDILQENHSAAESLFVKQESLHVTVSGSSQDVIKQKGRSKFERWTSHNEQVRDDLCHDLTGGMHYGSRITLSSKISRVRQCLSQSNYSAPEAHKAGDKGIELTMQSRAGKKGKLARKQNRKTKTASQQGVVDSSNRWYEQHVQKPLSKQHLDQLVAKLEKRRERFKLPVVERKEPMVERKEPPQMPATHDSQLADRVEVKPERPARKRSWGGG